MKRDSQSMPTIAEAGPIGARKTRAVAGGYREKVTKIQKGKTAKREAAVENVTRENKRQAEELERQVAELDRTIVGIEGTLKQEGLSSLVRESLEDQLAENRTLRTQLEHSEVIPLKLSDQESRILPDKTELFESAEKEATSREAITGELVLMAYEKVSEYGSALELSASSARVINEMYLFNGKEGKGIDQLLMEQYSSHPELLSNSVKKIIKANLETTTRKLIDAELAQVSGLGVATVSGLRTRLEAKYKTPEKVKEVIKSVVEDPEKSILHGYSVPQEIADLLLKEAVAQGADPKDLAIMLKLTNNVIRDQLSIQNTDRTILPLINAIKFINQRSFNPESYQFPLSDPGTKKAVEDVLGRELWEENRRYLDDNFRDKLLKFAKDINLQAEGMVSTSESRLLAKESLQKAQVLVPGIVQKSEARMEAIAAAKLAEGKGLLDNGVAAIAFSKELTVQMERYQRLILAELDPLKTVLESVTPAEFLSGEVAKQIGDILRKLNDELSAGQLDDKYYLSLISRMGSIYDNGAWGRGNDAVPATVKDYIEDSSGQIDLLKLIPGQSQAREWKNPDFSSLVRDAEQTINQLQGYTSAQLEKLFKGKGLQEMEAVKENDFELRKKARGYVSEVGGIDGKIQRDLRRGLLENAKPFQVELEVLLRAKLEAARAAYGKIDELEYAFDKLRKEKFAPIWNKLQAERKEFNNEWMQLDHQIGVFNDRIADFGQSFLGNFSGLGAGGADRRALEKASKDKSDLNVKIGINRAAIDELEKVFEAMNPIHNQLTQLKNKIFPPKRAR